MVESALISKLPNFNLSSVFFTLPDNLAQNIVSELYCCLTTTLFDDSKVTMARKPGKKQKYNPVGGKNRGKVKDEKEI